VRPREPLLSRLRGAQPSLLSDRQSHRQFEHSILKGMIF
jgi:hypothetical protein